MFLNAASNQCEHLTTELLSTTNVKWNSECLPDINCVQLAYRYLVVVVDQTQKIIHWPKSINQFPFDIQLAAVFSTIPKCMMYMVHLWIGLDWYKSECLILWALSLICPIVMKWFMCACVFVHSDYFLRFWNCWLRNDTWLARFLYKMNIVYSVRSIGKCYGNSAQRKFHRAEKNKFFHWKITHFFFFIDIMCFKCQFKFIIHIWPA